MVTVTVNGIKINKYAYKIVSQLQRRGCQAYLVGGCVRDMILGKQPKDWDITTEAEPEDVMRIFSSLGYEIIPTGLKHGTVTIAVTKEEMFEVTTYRVDGKYTDGRHPESVSFTKSLREDLARRDFTINAMAYDPVKQEIIDYFEGMKDLKNQIIRCVGDAETRFTEDYLRMLRAIRFACKLKFKCEANVLGAISTLANNITAVSGERIRDELFKMLEANPMKAMSMLRATGLVDVIVPELVPTYEFDQGHPAHKYDLWDHIVYAMNSKYAAGKIDIIVALMLHDIGKPNTRVLGDDGAYHYWGHNDESVKLAGPILDRLKVSSEFKNKVLALIQDHDTWVEGRKTVKKMLNKLGKETLLDLMNMQLADVEAHADDCAERRRPRVLGCIAEITSVIDSNECFKITDLKVNGDDLLALGMKPGKAVGAILKQLFEVVLENPELNDREFLLREVQKLLNNGQIKGKQ